MEIIFPYYGCLEDQSDVCMQDIQISDYQAAFV